MLLLLVLFKKKFIYVQIFYPENIKHHVFTVIVLNYMTFVRVIMNSSIYYLDNNLKNVPLLINKRSSFLVA